MVDKYNMLSMLSVYYPDLRKYRQLEKINNLLNISQYKQFIHYSETIKQEFYQSEQKNIILGFFSDGLFSILINDLSFVIKSQT